MSIAELAKTIQEIAIPGKGILAADESNGTIAKRFKQIDVESTEENRRAYREILITAPKLSKFISGMILYEETLGQKTKDGVPFPEYLAKHGIVPGIKVDEGKIPLECSPEEEVTQGLDGLPERLIQYKDKGARFAKWRAVYTVSDIYPSQILIKTNAIQLARYAAICQNQGIVPIVEPEVLIDGDHSLDKCAQVTEKVQHAVFYALHQYGVKLEYIILKPSMVIAGADYQLKPPAEVVARETIKLMKRTVPAAVPSINFLSGGLSNEDATAYLNAMHKLEKCLPWYVSFSYGRALQSDCLKAWAGKRENFKKAQKALLRRAKLNGLATKGKYSERLEK
ncbi:MAG: fructose-bisphosphate aldolase class I [Gammaproteobacteria bacterium]|nr:fructose-bisphosphate aldolase class I [Gammaproteobacteria bacterium]